MEALCRRILGVGKNIGTKTARWGTQRQFPKQRLRAAREEELRSLNTNFNTRRKPLAVKKQFGPVRGSNNRTQKLRIRIPVNRNDPFVLPSSSNNNTRRTGNTLPNLPPSPNGSTTRRTANTLPNLPPSPNGSTTRRTGNTYSPLPASPVNQSINTALAEHIRAHRRQYGQGRRTRRTRRT